MFPESRGPVDRGVFREIDAEVFTERLVLELIERVCEVQRTAVQVHVNSAAACGRQSAGRQVDLSERGRRTQGNVRRGMVQARALAGIHDQPDLSVLLLDEEEAHTGPNPAPEGHQATGRKLLEEVNAQVTIGSQALVPIWPQGRELREGSLNVLVGAPYIPVEVLESGDHFRGRQVANRLGHKLALKNLELGGVKRCHPTRSGGIQI
jgi:hypothetical protein